MTGGLFQHLDDQAQADLHAICHVRLYPKGARLFAEGQHARGLFSLCRGRAKLAVANSRGHWAIVRVATAGEVLGLREVMTNQPYEATAQTLEPTQVQYVERRDFHRFLRAHESISLRVIEQLSRELCSAYRHIVCALADGTTRAELARLLRNFANSEALPASDGVSFQLGLTHEEMSGIIGSSRETVSRVMSDFQAHGLIQIQGRFICVPDVDQLRALLA